MRPDRPGPQDPVHVLGLFYRWRFNYQKEKDLQDGIETVLRAAGVEFEREKNLVEFGTIDFLLRGGIGIEVKIKGSPADVIRQLHRYAQSPQIASLVLVTGKLSHGRSFPAELQAKPLYVVHLPSRGLI